MTLNRYDGTEQEVSNVQRVGSGGTAVDASAVERVMSDLTTQEVWTPLPDSGTYYGFENQSADSGTPDEWEIVEAPDGEEVTTTNAQAGSQSYRAYGTTGLPRTRPAVQPYGDYYTDIKSSVWVNQVDTGASVDQVGLSLYEDSTEIVRVKMQNGDLMYYDGSGNQTISTTPNAGEWVRLVITAVDPSSDTFDMNWETGTNSGTATGLSTMNAVTNGWNSAATLFYGQSSGSFVDEYEIFE